MGPIPLKVLYSLYPQSPSLMLVISFLLMALVFFNIFLGALSIILNGFRYLLVIGVEKGYNYMQYADNIAFFVLFFVILLFSDWLRYFLLLLIVSLAKFFAAIIGVF
jgi:hypothetical protein